MTPHPLTGDERNRIRLYFLDSRVRYGLVLLVLGLVLVQTTPGEILLFAGLTWLGVALALAAVGLYGLIAFHVARRGPEFGVRMALGASRQDILALVLSEGGRLLGAGFALGAPLAAALCWVMTAFLFGVVRPDPATLAGIPAVLLGAAAIALFVPAWRASRLDPVAALRNE